MESVNHTPTPWVVVEGDNQPYTSIKDGKGGMFDNGIASLVSNQRKENAAFIVRACNSHDDLLAACKRFVEVFESDDKPRSVFDDVETLRIIRHAILKAEGGVA